MFHKYKMSKVIKKGKNNKDNVHSLNHFTLLFTKDNILAGEEINDYPLQPYLALDLTELDGNISEIKFKIFGEADMSHRVEDENLFDMISKNSVIHNGKSLYKKFLYYVDSLSEEEIFIIKKISNNLIKSDDLYTFFLSGLMTYIFFYYIIDCNLIGDKIPFAITLPVDFNSYSFFNRNIFDFLNINLVPMRKFMSSFWTPVILLVNNFFNLFSSFFVYGVNIDQAAKSFQAVEIISSLTSHISNLLYGVKKQQDIIKKDLVTIEKNIMEKVEKSISKIERDVHNSLIDINSEIENSFDYQKQELESSIKFQLEKESKILQEKIENINENLENRIERIEQDTTPLEIWEKKIIDKPVEEKKYIKNDMSWDEHILKLGN